MKYQQQSLSTAHDQGVSTESLNVLCLDGGGVRGLSSLMILQDIIERVSNQYSPPILLRPCDLFDIICGTSTGGITALMLGRLRMTVDEAIEAYLDFSKTVFGKKKATDHPIYDASTLEKWIKNLVSSRPGEKRTSISDPQGCHTFVVAERRAHGDSPPKLFRTYPADGKPADDCEIWQAARATTAAAPFFEPATLDTIPRRTYVGGDLSGANNPSRLAIAEVESVFPSHKIGCLLSLGTGKPGDVVAIPQEMRKVADACQKILKSCEQVHDETFKGFKAGLGEGYTRLSVDRGLGNFPFDEWRETDLAGITEGYLASVEVKERVMKCMTKLKETVSKTRENTPPPPY